MRQIAKLVLTVTVLAAGAAVARAEDGGMPPTGGTGHHGPPPGGMMHHPGPGPGGGDGGHHGGQPGAPDGLRAAMLLAMAADADRSHDVTADEWSAFLASLGADENGVVSLDALAAALPLPPLPDGVLVNAAMRDEMLTRGFDADGDGVVTLADLQALFDLLDSNGDGALSQDDAPEGNGGGEGGHDAEGCMSGDAHRAGFLLAHAADADADHEVTADEWSAFLASLGADENGAVSLDALAAALPAPPHADGDEVDTARRDARLVRAFDFDGDGVVEVSDLQSIFDGMDANDDGAASKREVKRPKPLHGQDRKAAGHLFRAADADGSRDVSADEWTAFLGALGADATGAVSLDALADALMPARANGDESADTTRRDAKLVRLFDQDGDGVVELSDLQALFDLADANADGSLDRAELRPRR